MNGTTEASVRDAGNGVAIIDVGGEITAGSEDELMGAYGRVGDLGAKAVILNFAGLDYMNSGGIGLLVTVLIRANRNGHQLMASGLSDHYRQIFELTRLDEAISCYADEAAALAAALAG